MRTVTTKYPAVKHRALRKGHCPVCGKSVNRSRVFEKTVNPFNVGPDGIPLTHIEVLFQAMLAAEQWVPDFTHAKCKDAA